MEDTNAWLNEEFLISVVKASTYDKTTEEDGKPPTDVTIIDHKIKRAVEEGKNFSSDLYKLQIQFKYITDQVQTKKYIVKRLKEDIKDWFGDKETQVYKVLPLVEGYVDMKIGPRLYTHNATEIVLDDLNEEGFEPARPKLLDYEHCVLAIKGLAKFHAGTVLLHWNDPKTVTEKLGYETFTHSTFDYVHGFREFVLILADLVSKWPESEHHAPGIRNIATRMSNYFEDLPLRPSFRVLNHGDFWINNMLFRYEEGRPREVRFIDFQICRYAPPSCDIQYFIGISADLDVRLKRLEQLHTVYLDTLNDTLGQIGMPFRWSMERLVKGLRADVTMYFIGMVSPLASILGDQDSSFSLESVEGDMMEKCKLVFGNLMRSKRFREFVPPVLDSLAKQGAFQD